MRTQVIIEPVYGGWILFIDVLDEEGNILPTSRFFEFNRLIEALNAASAMRLHVDNIDDLPLHQYGMAS